MAFQSDKVWSSAADDRSRKEKRKIGGYLSCHQDARVCLILGVRRQAG